MALEIGKSYTLGYGIGRVKIVRSEAKGKAKAAVQESTGKRVNFGDPDMKNAPGTKRAENYCSRANNLNSRGFNANTLSLIDWECIPQKGKDTKDAMLHQFVKGTLVNANGERVTSMDEALKLTRAFDGCK